MIPLAYNLGSLRERRTTTVTAIVGIGLVVFVLAAALMLAEGVKHALGSAGREDVALVIRKGSDSELSSGIALANVGLVLASPEVRRGAGGKPIGVGEVVVVVALEKLAGTGVSNVNVRGVPDDVFKLRSHVQVVEGRKAKPGTDEAVIGRTIRGRFKGVQLGESIELRKNRTVRVVGVFDDGGSSFESEVWVDVDTLRTAFGRETMASSVRAQLTSASAFDTFKARVESDKTLGVLEAMRETTYYEKQSKNLAAFLEVLGGIIAFFFALGAMIGAMITMYASVASRQREIGTLRAIGFSRLSVLASFLLEAVMISVVGGALGGAASVGLGFVKFSMMNFATWSEVVFAFHPTPQILLIALGSSAVMGVAGGLLPAMRAARLAPVDAMRSL